MGLCRERLCGVELRDEFRNRCFLCLFCAAHRTGKSTAVSIFQKCMVRYCFLFHIVFYSLDLSIVLRRQSAHSPHLYCPTTSGCHYAAVYYVRGVSVALNGGREKTGEQMNRRESVWWLPLARRIVGWGLTTAALLVVPITVCAIVPLVLMMGPTNSETGAGGGIMELVATQLAPLLLPVLGLFVIGAACGACAPPREPRNPLASRFFGRVLLETISFGVLLSVVFAVIIPLVPFLFEVSNFGYQLLPVFGLVLAFALSLWFALTRALHAIKKPQD